MNRKKPNDTKIPAGCPAGVFIFMAYRLNGLLIFCKGIVFKKTDANRLCIDIGGAEIVRYIRFLYLIPKIHLADDTAI